MNYLEEIDQHKVPQHVAIIMDGNGRWAQTKGKDRVFGHYQGVESVREVLKAANQIGVSYLTLYTFSTENWNRPKDEVDALMELLVDTVIHELDELLENNVRLSFIGKVEELPSKCVAALEAAKEKTKNNSGVTLILALSYSSKVEIVDAVKSIASQVKNGELAIDEINSNTMAQHLYTSNYPDPELIIRTSGEQRISNFLLWQMAYSEFYFTPVLWPDFQKEEFYKAIYTYQNRERRFGKTSAQLKS